jgi:hypothetical protein
MADQTASLGTAQWAFIKKIRAAVKNDPKAFFAHHNWRHNCPSGGKHDGAPFNDNNKKTTVDAFYVRALHVGYPTC